MTLRARHGMPNIYGCVYVQGPASDIAKALKALKEAGLDASPMGFDEFKVCPKRGD